MTETAHFRKRGSWVTPRGLSRGKNNHLDGSRYTLVCQTSATIPWKNTEHSDAESYQLSKDLLHPFKPQGAKYEVCCKTSIVQWTKIWSLKLNLRLKVITWMPSHLMLKGQNVSPSAWNSLCLRGSEPNLVHKTSVHVRLYWRVQKPPLDQTPCGELKRAHWTLTQDRALYWKWNENNHLQERQLSIKQQCYIFHWGIKSEAMIFF